MRACRAMSLLLALAFAALRPHAAAADQIQHDYLSVQSGEAEDAAPIDPNSVESKVTNGDQANWLSEFWSVVRISYSTPRGASLCTGVLIDSDAVLTAGHCACGTDYTFAIPTGQGDIVTKTAKGYPQLYPGFSCEAQLDKQQARDLSLMHFNWVFDGRAPRIAHLLDVQQSTVTRKLAVIGFGKDENGRLPSLPNIAQVPVFSFFCSSGMAARSPCKPFREFALSVAGLDSGATKVDTCEGDSGGPVFAFRRKLKSDDPSAAPTAKGAQENVLVGITSRAMQGVNNIPGLNCGGGGIYTAVGNSDVLNWLMRQGVSLQIVSRLQLAGETPAQ
ncbi:S1 family peptidase [Mesorhizobium loti]|nr:S1 family peptidase [Mesorhizobium loti]